MKRTHAGRPRVDDDDETVEVGVSLPLKQFDEYARRAIREDVSVPEIIRRELGQPRDGRRRINIDK
jgi:hypothetical protein